MLLAQCHCSQNRVCVARPRSCLGSERPSIFQNERYCRFKQNKKRKEVSSELKSQRLSQRREAGGAQAKRWHWRRGNEVTHTPTLRETTHLARISAFRPSLDNRRRYMCRNGQKCPKLRTGPHATTKEATNMDVHALGRFRVPSRPTARRSGVPWHLRKTKRKDFYGITLLIPSAVIGDIHYAAYAASYAHLPGVRACLPSRPVDLFADQASAICSSYIAAP